MGKFLQTPIPVRPTLHILPTGRTGGGKPMYGYPCYGPGYPGYYGGGGYLFALGVILLILLFLFGVWWYYTTCCC